MSDLIERSRSYKCSSLECCNDRNALADEIERLTAEVTDLRDMRDKIWLECKLVSPRLGEIKRLIRATDSGRVETE